MRAARACRISETSILKVSLVTRLMAVEKSADSSATRCIRFLRVQCKEVCRLVDGKCATCRFMSAGRRGREGMREEEERREKRAFSGALPAKERASIERAANKKLNNINSPNVFP